MAPQNQNNPKKTAMKKKKVQFKNARTSSKKSPNKKTSSKNATAKKMMEKGSKVGALKKKAVSKRAGGSSAKRETRGLKKAMSKSAVERAERANKRSAFKEALSDKEPRAKKARLDLLKKIEVLPGLDLASLLATSDGVADIAAASGSRPLAAGGVEVDLMNRHELDLQLASSATIEEILAASSNFSRDANGEDEVLDTSSQHDLQLGSSATIEEIMAAASTSNLPRDAASEDEEMVENAELHSELDHLGIVGLDLQDDTFAASPMLDHAMEASSATEPSTLLEEIIMITASGGEESPSLHTIADQAAPSGSNVDHLGSDDPHAAMIAGARPRKVFLSPALVWLEQEGLPSARREVSVIAEAFGVKVEEEEVMRMAMDTWKKMAVEEKALWRKKAKEAEDYNKKM